MPHAAYSMFETPAYFASTENGESMREVEIRFKPGTTDFSVQAEVEPKARGTTEMRMYPKPQMDGRIGVFIAFGEQRLTLLSLRRMVQHVKGILDWLKPAFDPSAATD